MKKPNIVSNMAKKITKWTGCDFSDGLSQIEKMPELSEEQMKQLREALTVMER